MERKRRNNEELRMEMEKVQVEAVEKIALENVERTLRDWFESFENIRDRREFEPREFSQILGNS